MLLHTKLYHLTMTGENHHLNSLHDQPQAEHLDQQGRESSINAEITTIACKLTIGI